MKFGPFVNAKKKNQRADNKIVTFPKGENIMKSNMNTEEKLKKIIQRRREEQEKSKEVPHQKMYARMVQEAVLVTTSEWEMRAKYGKSIERGVELDACAFFVVEDTLCLYSDVPGVPNPSTGKSCFYDGFTFESMDEFKKYVGDVKEHLPKGTEVETRRYDSQYTTVLDDGPEIHVFFKFKIE